LADTLEQVRQSLGDLASYQEGQPPEVLPGADKAPALPPSSGSLKASKLLSEAKAFSQVLAAWRLMALGALLECEDALYGFRQQGLTQAPVEALPPVQSPLPPKSGGSPGGASAMEGPATRRRLYVMAAATILLAVITVLVGVLSRPGPPKVQRLHVYNGLGTTVTVDLGEARQALAPSASFSVALPQDRQLTLSASTSENLIESFKDAPEAFLETGAEEGEEAEDDAPADLVYNVAGAAPLIEWEAVYAPQAADGPPAEIRLGAPVFLGTRADFVLMDPPETIVVKGGDRTRTVLSALSGVHPDRMLEAVEPGDRAALAEAQGRWGRPEVIWTPVWLDRLVKLSPRAERVLSARLEDFPLDPRTNELFAMLAGPEAASGWCQSLMGLMTGRMESLAAAPDADRLGDQAFLSALCLPQEEREAAMARLLELHPGHPWLNRSAGLKLFRQDDLPGALSLLEAAMAADPSSLAADLMTFARIRHYFGADLFTLSSDLGPFDQSLARLAKRSPLLPDLRPAGGQLTEDQAYALLEAGRLSEALTAAEPGVLSDKLLILAAAAPGASPELIELALSLPPDRARAAGVPWSGLGLALRAGRSPEIFEVDASSDPSGPAKEAVEAIKSGRGDLLPGLYLGREPWFQGQVCLAAMLALGDGAPADCPARAAGFLFPGERPPLDKALLASPLAESEPLERGPRLGGDPLE
jgi:tetratricopeptide (TPR) repeat protein